MSQVDDLPAFVAAGLVPPDCAPDDERIEALRWFAAQGFSIDEMVEASNGLGLAALAGDTLHRTGVRWTIRQVAEQAGLTVQQVVEARAASGIVRAPVDVPVYTDDDLAAFDLLAMASQLFSWDQLLQFQRVVGTAISTVAAAANSLFLHDIERPLRSSGGSQLDLAAQSVRSMELAHQFNDVLRMLMRIHLDQAVHRSRQLYANNPDDGPLSVAAIGFVDLAGFTQRSNEIDAAELSRMIAAFEETAFGIITEEGGWMVKLIGDEVMFAAVDAFTGCRVAAGLLRALATDPALLPRGGLAFGPVLSQSGDYFGDTVNLAARLAGQAVPGEVLATPAAAVDGDGWVIEPAGRRLLKGFAEPVRAMSLTVS